MINRVKSYFRISFIFICTLAMLLPLIFATTVSAAASYITDEANLLTENERGDLNKQLDTFTTKNGYSIYLYTVNDTNGIAASTYLSDQADSLSLNDGILVLVNMDSSNREIIIQSYGSIQDVHFPPERLQKITESIKGYFTDKEYKKGFDRCISMLSDYSKSSIRTDAIFYRSWFQAIIAIVLATIVVSIMAINSGGKVTTTQGTYLNTSTSKLLGRRDRYVRTSITRTKRETNSGGGGGGSRGSSSGGRSYSQGSSKF